MFTVFLLKQSSSHNLLRIFQSLRKTQLKTQTLRIQQNPSFIQANSMRLQYNKIILIIKKKQWRKMYGEVKVQDSYRHQKPSKKSKQQSSESDQFQLQYHQIKKLGLPVNKKKLRVGNWTPEQNLIYLKFLEQNKSDFISEQQRRKNKVFYRLSKILKKRTPDQCRSHHQKLQMKYEDNIDQIIQNIQRKLEKKSPEVFQDQLKKVQICHKKTAITDIIQQKKQQLSILQEGKFYKLTKKGQNQFSLEILLDCIKAWN